MPYMNEIYKTLAEGYEKWPLVTVLWRKTRRMKKEQCLIQRCRQNRKRNRLPLRCQGSISRQDTGRKAQRSKGTSSEIRFWEAFWCKSGKLCGTFGPMRRRSDGRSCTVLSLGGKPPHPLPALSGAGRGVSGGRESVCSGRLCWSCAGRTLDKKASETTDSPPGIRLLFR